MSKEPVISKSVKAGLDELHARFNRREMLAPDPLQFLYSYKDVRDREIAGLIAASLAYGRVAQILKSVERVLDLLPLPARFLKESSEKILRREFSHFKHRFTTGAEVSALMLGMKYAIEKHGLLLHCFRAGLSPSDETILPALTKFLEELKRPSGGECGSLLASPRDGSACKRMNLFLRWMVRRDSVDPGGWEAVGAHRLVMPLDTHIYRICRTLGMTRRKSPDLRTALEITAAFRTIAPHDPIRYDFAISRLGIRKDASLDEFLVRCRAA